MDGGTVWNTNLIGAINRCREIVTDDSQIEIDVLECSTLKSISLWDDKLTIGNYLRDH